MAERPRLQIAHGPLGVVGEGVALGGVGLALAITAHGLAVLPPQLPTHFDASGAPDAWGSRTGFAAIALVAVLSYGMMTAISRAPHAFNYVVEITQRNAPVQYRIARTGLAWVKALTSLMFAWLQWRTMQTALGAADGLGPAFLGVAMLATTVLLVSMVTASWRAR